MIEKMSQGLWVLLTCKAASGVCCVAVGREVGEDALRIRACLEVRWAKGRLHKHLGLDGQPASCILKRKVGWWIICFLLLKERI